MGDEPSSGTRVCVILPCLNEEDVLEEMHHTLTAALRDTHGMSVTTLYVDDGSTDGTWEAIRALAAQGIGPRVLGIRLDGRHGKSAAQAIGIRRAWPDHDLIALMDSDGQHDPECLPTMIQQTLTTGVPCIGVRGDYRRSRVSRVGTRLLKAASRLVGVDFDPATSEYLVLPQNVARRLTNTTRLGVVPLVPVVHLVSRETTTVPFDVKPRLNGAGDSRWTLGALWQKGILHLLADPWTLLPRLAAAVALLVVLFGTYGLAVGISSMLNGTFMGIGSIIIAVVFIGGALAVLSLLCLGVIVIALQTTSLTAGYSPVIEEVDGDAFA